MPHDHYRALYLHVPFCVKRCSYCDFTTAAVAADDPRIDAYVEDLCLAIRHKSKEGELSAIETVYLGGGTPSHIGMSRLSMLLYALSTSMRLEPDVECSMEANPESLTPNMVRDIWALGVNRLSIGVQSFDDKVLETIGRAHDAQAACRAIRQRELRSYVRNPRAERGILRAKRLSRYRARRLAHKRLPAHHRTAHSVRPHGALRRAARAR